MALPAKTAKTSKFPQFNLEQLHRSIKHTLPIPHGGIGSIILAIVLWCVFVSTTEPPKSEPRVLHPGGAAGKSASQNVFEQQNKKLEEELAKMQKQQAERRRLEDAEKEKDKPKPVELGAIPKGHVRVVAGTVPSEVRRPQA